MYKLRNVRCYVQVVDIREGWYDDLQCEGGEVARLPAPVDQVGDQHPVQGHRVHQEVGGLH